MKQNLFEKISFKVSWDTFELRIKVKGYWNLWTDFYHDELNANSKEEAQNMVYKTYAMFAYMEENWIDFKEYDELILNPAKLKWLETFEKKARQLEWLKI